MKNLRIGLSPENLIVVGKLLEDGSGFENDEIDVTGMMCGLVAQHVVNTGEPVVVCQHNVPMYEITVRML